MGIEIKPTSASRQSRVGNLFRDGHIYGIDFLKISECLRI